MGTSQTAVSEQQSQLGQRLQSLKAVTLRASAVGDQLADVHAQISTVKESNRVRAEQLEAASKQLAAKRTELLVHVMPDAMRSNQLLLSMHSEELYVEQQKRMSKLLQILPLNLAGFRRGASPRTPGACVTLMGLRLPEDLKPTVDGQQQAQALGTALGYFATLSCLVAYYLDGPSLYMVGSFSSTSVLWSPRSFWDQLPAGPSHIFRLHLQTVPACPTTLLPERTASQPTVSLTSLANSTIWGNAAGGNTVRVGKGQQDPELRNALHMLNRNVGALLAHTAGPSIHKVAPDLSVFAKLERLCASVLREPGHTPAAAAASASVTASIFAAGMAESCMDMSMLPDVNGESSDDWHLIQRSAELQAAVADLGPDRRPPVLLAPLPSADASEAEHWARAMSTASAATGQLSSRVLAAAADRLRYLRRTR
ncbi:MAG: hypothetical protein FRX49_03452 [Trebouxia sp. A1-2]|nr:MAG: hypothetical protein FRX49_03452 [Trebouxia sp. A1-2]